LQGHVHLLRLKITPLLALADPDGYKIVFVDYQVEQDDLVTE
jgi:hypothetical protein